MFKKNDYEIIAVSNRKACTKDFYKCIDDVIKDGVRYLILREKDLDYKAYVNLTKKINAYIEQKETAFLKTELILNTGAFKDLEIIRQLMADTGCKNLHVPFQSLKYNKEFIKIRNIAGGILGMSIHDKEEAVKAQKYGADYVTAGHIFETSCKPGLKPRGLDFLTEVCESVDIPVYAIGGINKENAPLVIGAGAEGICIMSGYFH